MLRMSIGERRLLRVTSASVRVLGLQTISRLLVVLLVLGLLGRGRKISMFRRFVCSLFGF